MIDCFLVVKATLEIADHGHWVSQSVTLFNFIHDVIKNHFKSLHYKAKGNIKSLKTQSFTTIGHSGLGCFCVGYFLFHIHLNLIVAIKLVGRQYKGLRSRRRLENEKQISLLLIFTCKAKPAHNRNTDTLNTEGQTHSHSKVSMIKVQNFFFKSL